MAGSLHLGQLGRLGSAERSGVSTPSLAALTLTSTTITENSPTGTLVGAILGASPGSSLSLVDNSGNRFAMSGGNIVAGAVGTNFEAATSHQITLREVLAGASNSPRDTTIVINVTNVNEQPSLSALTLSSNSATQGSNSTINIVAATAGSTIAGAVPDGMVLNSAARTISGTPTTAGTYNFSLTETLADSPNSPRVSNVTITVGLAPVVIGGVEVGTVGTSGYVDGYTLSGGDDFNGSLDIIGPARPRGKYSTTRGAYVIGASGQFARGSGGLSGYNADPLHTGFNDSNRGQPVPHWSDIITQENGELTIKTRQRITADEPFMRNPTKKAIGSMLHTGFAFLARPPLVFQWCDRNNSSVWSHITRWVMQANSYFSVNDLELDIEAASFSDGTGDGRDVQYNVNLWNNGVVTNLAGNVEAVPANTDIVWAFQIDENGDARIYRDGVLKRTYTGARALALARPFYMLWTAHSYELAPVNSTPASLTVKWYQVWRKGGQHYRPLVAGDTYRVDYGGTGSWVLPDQTTVWGGSVTEIVEAGQQENNEPGGTLDGVVYDPLPTGVTYNAGTRTLSVANTVTLPGRLHIMRYVNQVGSTCEPQRIIVEVGPRITVPNLNPQVGVPFSYDVYAACDVGIILPKTITVTGLPAGLSFNPATGLITGTATTESTQSVTITCTNASEQPATKVITLTVVPVAPSYAYESWTGPGWFDASDTTSVILGAGSAVASMNNKRSGGGNLTAGGAANGLLVGVRTQNSKQVISVTRNVSTATSPPRLTASQTAPVSTMFQGNDKPYTVIVAYCPRDTNTGYIWAASDAGTLPNTQQIGLIRRNSTSSSVRRQLLDGTPNDVSWGSGQASGTPRIVAIKHTGTAVTVWDNSAATKSVNGAAQDVGEFTLPLWFRLFAASISQGSLANVQSTMDFYEIVLESTARSDADVQQAITDMAAKWGITLS